MQIFGCVADYYNWLIIKTDSNIEPIRTLTRCVGENMNIMYK